MNKWQASIAVYNRHMFTSSRNLIRLLRSNRHMEPVSAIYYLTEQCNFNCTYCEDFGSHRNNYNSHGLVKEKVFKILEIIRQGTKSIMFSGGEPFSHPAIDEILEYSKKKAGFKELSLITNGSMLDQHEAGIKNLDRLIISLDSVNVEQVAKTTGSSVVLAKKVLDNIELYAAKQAELGIMIIINTVLTPETIEHAHALLNFCEEKNILISFSPQAVNNWPKYELITDPGYKEFIQKIIIEKKQGGPVFGSEEYYNSLLNFHPYDCLPTLTPRIYTNGDLAYPCRPLEKAENGQGGRAINLLDHNSWDEAWKAALQRYGQPPRTCHSCFQQCYAEPSLMQTKPASLIHEWFTYKHSRRGNLSTYSPG